MDKITLRGVRAYGRHGAYPGERNEEQAFDVELTLDVDLRAAQASDDLQDAPNYDDLHKRVVAIVETTSHALLERLAGEIVEAACADPRVAHAEATVGKPGLLAGATAYVTIARDNPRFRATFP
jgi:dihydroneopterin aldolase